MTYARADHDNITKYQLKRIDFKILLYHKIKHEEGITPLTLSRIVIAMKSD